MPSESCSEKQATTGWVPSWMIIARQGTLNICVNYLRRQSERHARPVCDGKAPKHFTHSSRLPQRNGDKTAASKGAAKDEEEQGGMSRRLSQITEESLDQDGRGMKKAIEEGGFSEDLKKRLEARIHDSTFRSAHPAAFAELNMPVSREVFHLLSTPESHSIFSLALAKEPVMWP